MSPRILFVCTGNYYRSRFAEAVFNHHAQHRSLAWRAYSRGLAIHLADGDISEYTVRALRARGIPLHHTGPTRVALSEADLTAASLVIALKKTEHLPMMREQFPAWADRIVYWEQHDLDVETPEESLPKIEQRVLEVLENLINKEKRS